MVSPSPAIWRCVMPVRWTIHASRGVDLVLRVLVGHTAFAAEPSRRRSPPSAVLLSVASTERIQSWSQAARGGGASARSAGEPPVQRDGVFVARASSCRGFFPTVRGGPCREPISIAPAKPSASTPPWLLITTPSRPRNTAPLASRGDNFAFRSSKALPRQEGAEPVQQIAGQSAAQIGADLLRGAFGGLQRDIAGKTFGDHDVDRAARRCRRPRRSRDSRAAASRSPAAGGRRP